jgi:hypothetical protein
VETAPESRSHIIVWVAHYRTRILKPGVVLLAAVAVAAIFSVAATGSTSKARIVNLDTRRAIWTNTGVTLGKGRKVTIRVTGDGKCGGGTDCPAGDPFGSHHTCGGRTLGPLKPGRGGPLVDYGSVVAKVGAHGTPFMTGHRHTAVGPGVLYVLFDDCAGYYSDNSGSFTLTIT